MTTLLWVFTVGLWILALPCPAQSAEEAAAEPAAAIPAREQAPLPATAVAPLPAAPTPPAPVAVPPAPVAQAPAQAPVAAPAAPVTPAPTAVNATARVVIDDFEGSDIENRMGARTNVFQKAPSKAMISRRDDVIEGRRTRVLLLRYDKQAEGGPYGMGGWCGYYTLLKKPAHLIAPATDAFGQPERSEEQYLDGAGHQAITFWVRGAQGGESFMVGLSDRHWDKVGDSVKSEVIGKYLPTGRVTTAWQKAVVPLDVFFVDYAKLGSIAISFESDAFPDGHGAGTIYLDDLALE